MRSTLAFSSFFLAALLAGPFGLQAGEAPLLRTDLGYASEYVFRGVEQTGASAQATLEAARDDFRGSFWTNLPFAGGEERELNLAATYTWQALKKLKVEISARQYWYSQVPAGGTKESFETACTATFAPISGITPSLDYAHDFRLQSDTVQVSLAHSFALTGIGAYLDLSCFAAWVTGDNWRPDTPGPPRHDSYGYVGAEAYLPYRIGPHATIITGLHYTVASGLSTSNGPSGRTDDHNLWFTLAVSLDF